jgi:hypothetical protein
MSEKKNRSLADIHAEYSNVCAKAGHVQYGLYIAQKDLELLNQQLKDLNFEAVAASKAGADAKAAEVPNG